MRSSPDGLSVIIPVLNGADHIGQQLDALAQQVDPDVVWEVIVADNGSTDGTQEQVFARSNTFPVPLRIVDASSRRGVSFARNTGAAAATGRLLLFCDADDVVRPDWVRSGVAALADASAVMGLIRELEEPLRADAAIVNPGCLVGRGIQSCNFGVRRSVFFQVGGFDASLPPWGCEDSEFSIRLLDAGHAIEPAPTMQIHFRRTTSFVRTLRKVYASGIAEVVVWHRHPQHFGKLLSARTVLIELVQWPLHEARSRRAGPRTLRQTARSLVTRVAHIAGFLTWVRPGRMGSAEYVTDPLGAQEDTTKFEEPS